MPPRQAARSPVWQSALMLQYSIFSIQILPRNYGAFFYNIVYSVQNSIVTTALIFFQLKMFHTSPQLEVSVEVGLVI